MTNVYTGTFNCINLKHALDLSKLINKVHAMKSPSMQKIYAILLTFSTGNNANSKQKL